MSNLLQPADVGWFAKIKRSLHNKWNEWYLSENYTYTKFNNMLSPGYALCIEWLSQIWKDFPVQEIKNSFEQCCIISPGKCHSDLLSIL